MTVIIKFQIYLLILFLNELKNNDHEHKSVLTYHTITVSLILHKGIVSIFALKIVQIQI